MYGWLAAGPVSVRREADAPAGRTQKKDLQIAGLYKAAEGIRTLDLLHGKQTRDLVQRAISLQIRRFCRASGCRRCPAFTAKSREFPD
jgi:hypothetical protein